MAANVRREIGRNRRKPSFLGLGTRITTDGSMEKRMTALPVHKSCLHCVKNFVNFGPLTPEFTRLATIYAQMGEIGQMHSILGTRIRQCMAETAERFCAKFAQKTCSVLRSNMLVCQGQKSKVTRDKKRAVHSQHPQYMDEMERPRCR